MIDNLFRAACGNQNERTQSKVNSFVRRGLTTPPLSRVDWILGVELSNVTQALGIFIADAAGASLGKLHG